MSAYDDYMAIAKRQAQAGSLHQALEALRSAQEIDDNEKVRRRIQKIREAIEDEEEDETTDEERDAGEGSRDDSGFQVRKSKMGFAFSMVISSEFRMWQYRTTTIGEMQPNLRMVILIIFLGS